MSRVITLKPGACRLGGLVPQREVKGGGRDALNGGVGSDAENCVKGRRFLPSSPGYAVKSFWAEAKLG